MKASGLVIKNVSFRITGVGARGQSKVNGLGRGELQPEL
jgi:hypothetical protein